MFKHIGMLTLIADTTEEQITAIVTALEKLKNVVPGLVSAEILRDSGLSSGNAHLTFRMELVDRDAWETYRHHPAHVKVVREFITPVLSSKIFLQSER